MDLLMYQPEVPVLHGADATCRHQDACLCTTDALRSRAQTNLWVQSGDTHGYDYFGMMESQDIGTWVKPFHCAAVVCIWHLQLHVYVMSPASLFMVCLLELTISGALCTDMDPWLVSCIQRTSCLITAGSISRAAGNSP